MLNNIQVQKGKSIPLGLSFQKETANFALFSKNATRVTLGLFAKEKKQPEIEIPMHRTKDVWHVAIKGLPLQGVAYAFRCEGPYDEQKGLLFKGDQWLIDPYAQKVAGYALVEKMPEFDWQGVTSPKIAPKDLVIYEMHVRGFTAHSSSKVAHRGTFLGLIEKIPYLKELGINAVELLPICQFEEKCPNVHPKTQNQLTNYWGYQPLHFYSPVPRYAVADPIEEFKMLVRELHRNGIAVILDVVFNHTGEGIEKRCYINFRGIDNPIYYMVDPQGNYLNFSGCGNTFNCNHPVVQRFILDNLRYWVKEMHVDGFRFDSAGVFMRDVHGTPTTNPPLLKALAKDPVLRKVKLIAEPWDALGNMQIGNFAKKKHWSEWNGQFRDAVRRFIKGTDEQVSLFANVLSGSKMLYKSPLSSINFVTAHDGFSLCDLVSYHQKYNDDNGESSRDGVEQNESWNCGVEGVTNDKNILELRQRQMRNFFLCLFLAQGIPMLQMGDEYGHTRFGNNNPYVQDNEVSWFLWNELENRKKIFNFVSQLIAFRKKHANLHHARYLTRKEVDWHGLTPFKPDWGNNCRFIALTFKGKVPLYLAFNASAESLKATLPRKLKWRQVVNTAEDWNFEADGNRQLSSVELIPYSAILASGL